MNPQPSSLVALLLAATCSLAGHGAIATVVVVCKLLPAEPFVVAAPEPAPPAAIKPEPAEPEPAELSRAGFALSSITDLGTEPADDVAIAPRPEAILNPGSAPATERQPEEAADITAKPVREALAPAVAESPLEIASIERLANASSTTPEISSPQAIVEREIRTELAPFELPRVARVDFELPKSNPPTETTLNPDAGEATGRQTGVSSSPERNSLATEVTATADAPIAASDMPLERTRTSTEVPPEIPPAQISSQRLKRGESSSPGLIAPRAEADFELPVVRSMPEVALNPGTASSAGAGPLRATTSIQGSAANAVKRQVADDASSLTGEPAVTDIILPARAIPAGSVELPEITTQSLQRSIAPVALGDKAPQIASVAAAQPGDRPGMSAGNGRGVLPSFAAGNAPPTYPTAARAAGLQGRVALLVYISAEGLPTKIEMHTSSGHKILDDVAVQAVRRWRFNPAQDGGRPIESTVIVPLRFILRD